jgi:hypothetical protein
LAKQYAKNVPLPDARRNVEKALNIEAGKALAHDKVYFVLIGEANPIEFPSQPTKAQINRAVKARRDGKDGASVPNSGNTKGMSLLRWETVAASASVGLGRKVSVKEAREMYGKKPSYTGRGTRKQATNS